MASSDASECSSSLLESIDEAPSLRVDTLRQLARDLDVERLDAPIVQRVVGRFLDDARESVPALVQAVAEGEWAEAAGVAHRIKGGAAHVGAVALSEAGRAVERGVEDERFDQVRHVAAALPELLARADAQLREAVGPPPE